LADIRRVPCWSIHVRGKRKQTRDIPDEQHVTGVMSLPDSWMEESRQIYVGFFFAVGNIKIQMGINGLAGKLCTDVRYRYQPCKAKRSKGDLESELDLCSLIIGYFFTAVRYSLTSNISKTRYIADGIKVVQ
jgi:hypothetical protein